jgi:uncharacterized membrane protein YidH (DUF202 family)
VGTALVILGVGVNLLAALQHYRILQRLNRGEPYQAPAWSLGIAVSLVLAVLGMVMVVYLFRQPAP